jgi:pectate lyase
MRISIAVCVIGLIASVAAAQEPSPFHADRARETLAANDGWASFGAGTTGGSAATPDRVFVVTNRAELIAALGSGSAPRIIFVKGTIDANVDEANQPLACSDYAAGTGYTLEAYLQAYDPATWGRTRLPSGPLESARNAARARQQNRVRVNLTSNTTLLGFGPDARIVGAHVRVNNVQNVIIRNMTFEDAYDCFPQWDPTDGSQGNWNSAYDNISLTGATNVWIDHCELNDGAHPDSAQPSYFGRPYVIHDGLVDITNASDLATVSWNRFLEHDKVMLIGSSDSATADVGKLRVTVHHNVFDTNVQRAPRVRFGQVHVFNNYYLVDAQNYGYSWGVGVQSQIYAENNFFRTNGVVAPSRFISRFNGNLIFVGDTLVNGHARADHVDVLAEYNSARDPDLSDAVTWAPVLYTLIHPTQAVEGLVRNNAGRFREFSHFLAPWIVR